MRVKLLSITSDLEPTIAKVWEVAKSNQRLERINPSKVNVGEILKADLPVAEFVSMVWFIEGMPRAFWDQLDRTRVAAFWEQSVRILDVSTFADKKNYHTPDSVKTHPYVSKMYDEFMYSCQEMYNRLLESGIPSEDARGVLPLHLNVRGTMAINLRALRKMISSRVCFIAQGGYWFPVIQGMLKELKKVLPPATFDDLVRLPCEKSDRCPIESNVLPRLQGEDPNPCCPVYVNKYAKDYVGTARKNLRYGEAERTYLKFLKQIKNVKNGGNGNGSCKEETIEKR